MSSIFIQLDSATAIANNPNNTSDNFTTDYYQGITVKNTDKIEWAVGLIRADVWNSIPNISDTDYSNATFDYSIDGGVTTEGPFIIPEGTYSIEDINDYLHSIMFDNGHYGGSATNPLFAIDIVPNFQTLRVDVLIRTPPAAGDPGTAYELTIPASLNILLGFSVPTIVTTDTTGDQRVDITFGVNQVSINLDIVEDGGAWGGNGLTSQTIAVYQPDVPPGALIQIVPVNPVYLKLGIEQIRRIQCYFTDSLRRPVNFRGEDVVVSIELKPLKK